MPTTTKLKDAEIATRSATLLKIPKELIDQFVTGPMSARPVLTGEAEFKHQERPMQTRRAADLLGEY